MRTCCECGVAFAPTGKGYRCPPCRLAYDRAWRAQRRAAGKPVSGASMAAEYHRAYQATYGARPDVKARRNEAARQRARDPAQRHKHEARWKARRAIAAGRLVRRPCEVCGAPKVDAHHDDYSRPLEVRWLCRTHHREHHAKAEGK